jgi:hypothetical protein
MPHQLVTLKYIQYLPGFNRLCYKGNDNNHYVFQDGQWLSASKDWEPCCPVSNITFRLEGKIGV